MEYYEIAPTKIIRADKAVFTYVSSVPLKPGSIVIISVGKQSLTGVVIKRVSKPPYDTKPVSTILEIPPLPQALLETTLWVAAYYSTPLATVLQTILPRGITKKRRPLKKAIPSPVRDRTNYLLNNDQSRALEQLHEAAPGTVILHGVTGSGKTAVYIEYAKTVLAKGKSVIILTPEIALTSQLIGEFQHHFGDIILTHSRQTEAARHHAWLNALQSTRPRIAIGPRSALFLPLSNIGAIIIDEAHEPSFKQDQSPRYSSLRVASVLAQHHRALVIQGSATPLISEYYIAIKTHRPIIHMSNRAQKDAVAPAITVIDMTKKSNFTKHRFLSDHLISAIAEAISAGNQTLIFHNRRGSASTTLCEQCGWAASCSRCFTPLTLHGDTHQLRCHICDRIERVPTSCPVCQSTDIIHKGLGTKLIEHEIKKLFPNARIARFDGDTESANTVEQRYQELYDGTINIIIGTQVIAKGLDLPYLRTVGVIQADAGLFLPDFMASERAFQLLAQVIGRVGRSHHKTTAIVQSYRPDDPAIRYGISQDFAQFYHDTIVVRQCGNFPPFTYLLKLTCVYRTEPAAIRNAQHLAKTLRLAYPTITIFGPTPSFYERQHDTYRWQIIVKSADRHRLLEIVSRHLPTTHWQYDLDPMSLL